VGFRQDPHVGIDAVEPADNLGTARRVLREDSGKVPRRDLQVDAITVPRSDHLLCDAMALLSLSMGDPERHVARPDQDRRARLNQRLRQSFIEGAEVDMRRLLGRGLTAEELERVLRRYPGDVGDRRE
jgi:hypothetical protein